MKFYHNLITSKSWQVLQDLQKELNFILIGGWAVWLYAKTLKSKDIDIVLDYDQLEKIGKKYDLAKNSHLKKYGIKIGKISVDIYVSFYSHLGIPVEEIGKLTESVGGFRVPVKEVLLILKQKAYSGRKLSIKGRKDLVDIFSLILLPDFDWNVYYKFIKRYRLMRYLEELKEIIKTTQDIEELNLNQHKFAKIKKKLLEK